MIQRREKYAGIGVAYRQSLVARDADHRKYDGMLEYAQQMANHFPPHATKLYDWDWGADETSA
jgi:hypothetical protein